jgi:DNA-binding transcriptional MocR family regulator
MTVRFYGGATAAVFAPLEPLSRVELVSRRLTDAIALGLLRDGSQLPGEADLARAFGVSTVTVREALTALRHRDLIETRRGRGGGRSSATGSWRWGSTSCAISGTITRPSRGPPRSSLPSAPPLTT